MARPKKWVTAQVDAPIYLGKSGIKIVVWDKWGRTRRGTAVITVGGIRWFPYKAKKPTGTVRWDSLES